jgi:hypothetical protein
MSGVTEVHINMHSMIRLKHSPYSPDLVLSDLSFFPKTNEKLRNIQMVDEEDVFPQLQELLDGIFRKESDKVFGTWINRLIIVSQGDGADIS